VGDRMSLKRAKMKSKKGQFYIIASVIIIVLIISLATIRNYAIVKTEPKKFYDVTDVLEMEGLEIIDNTNYNKGDINKNIDVYLALFADYLEQNTDQDFNLIILYGDVASGNMQGRVFSRASLGGVSISAGSTSFDAVGGTEVQNGTIPITVADGKARITLNNTQTGEVINQEVPILEDNNFIFIMTTNDGFNQYVQTNLPK